jgi:hypothetical protein
VPPIGHSVSVNIDNARDVLLTSSGPVAAWLGVTEYDSHGNPIDWIQAGIYQYPGSANTVYVETMLNGDHEFPYLNSSGSYGTNYTVTLNHVGNQEWSESVGGSPTIPLNGFAPNNMIANSENQNATATCQASDFYFSSLSGETTSQGTKSANTPYQVLNVTSSGWESTGPIGFIWPS